MTEEWRPVVGFEGLYEVSSIGRVRGLDRTVTRSDGRATRVRGRVLAPGLVGRDGRFRVNLNRGGVITRAYVSRLVAQAFVPNPEGKPYVLHWDDNPRNNTPDNLHWGTHAENMAEMSERGRHVSPNAAKTHCKRGHDFTPENTYVKARSRECRKCYRERNRQWWAENRKKPQPDRDPETTVTQFVEEHGRLPKQGNPTPERALYLRFHRARKRDESWAVELHARFT